MTSSFESTPMGYGETEFHPDTPGIFVPNASDAAPARHEAEGRAAQERLRAETYESGHEKGLATAQTLCEPALRALSAAADELTVQQRQYLEAQRESIVTLAIEIAEVIIGRELSAHPDWIIDRIGTALGLVDHRSPVTVELNPKDHATATRGEAAASLGENVRLVANPQLGSCDFLVASGSTSIDARLAPVLEGVRRALAGLESLPQTTTTTDETPGATE